MVYQLKHHQTTEYYVFKISNKLGGFWTKYMYFANNKYLFYKS